MSIARMVNSLGRFLNESGFDERGVKLVIEFEDEIKARLFAHKMYEEFAPHVSRLAPPAQISEQRIYGIAVEIKTLVKVG